jgi:hypothetical protein
MGEEDYIGKDALEIHYFLLNSGFEYTKMRTDTADENGIVKLHPAEYRKEDTLISFEEMSRLFVIYRSGEIIFQVDAGGLTISDAEGSPMFSDWTIESLRDDITLNDILPFFRDDKIKDLFKDV